MEPELFLVCPGRCLEISLMKGPALVFAQEGAGVHARIWRYEDGRFLFERVGPGGKGIAVFCPTFEEALELSNHWNPERPGRNEI